MSDAGSADPWSLGTGLTAGASIPYLVGYEWDTVISGCKVPPVTILMHWVRPPGSDKPSDADAVRYTADSGARVFSAGAMQFSWGLDNSGSTIQSADPRVQLFMNTALDDLTRPAAPASIAVNSAPNGLSVAVRRHPDPRFAAIEIYAHPGVADFAPGDPDARIVCRTTGSSCAPHSRDRWRALRRDRDRSLGASFAPGPLRDGQPASADPDEPGK